MKLVIFTLTLLFLGAAAMRSALARIKGDSSPIDYELDQRFVEA